MNRPLLNLNNTSEYLSYPGVYGIRCLVNNRIYVGSSIDMEKRHRSHSMALTHHKPYATPRLLADYQKYGHDAFTFEVLKPVIIGNMLMVEEAFIIELRSWEHEFGYNVHPSPTDKMGGLAKIQRSIKLPLNQK